MINYSKLLRKLKDRGITTYMIRQQALIPQSTLTKFNMCSVSDKDREKYPKRPEMEIIKKKLEEYQITHGNEFKTDVSTKTIEDICQLLQCQPQDIMEWNVELNSELSYEWKYGKVVN